MKVVFSHALTKKESLSSVEKGWLLKAFAKGIYQFIKGDFLPANSKLAKLYMTTTVGARRAVFLIDMESKDGFFLMLRSKKDPVGANITMKNQKFKETLKKYLLLLKEDLKNKKFEIFKAD